MGGNTENGNVVHDAMIGSTVEARFPWRGWWAQCTSATFLASVAILRRREGLCFVIGGLHLPQKSSHVLVDLVGVASDEMVISNVYFAVDRDSQCNRGSHLKMLQLSLWSWSWCNTIAVLSPTRTTESRSWCSCSVLALVLQSHVHVAKLAPDLQWRSDPSDDQPYIPFPYMYTSQSLPFESSNPQ